MPQNIINIYDIIYFYDFYKFFCNIIIIIFFSKLRKDKNWRQPIKTESKEQDLEKKSIIRTLLDEYNKQQSVTKRPVRDQQTVKDEPVENSISRQLLNSINQSPQNNIQKLRARYFSKIILSFVIN